MNTIQAAAVKVDITPSDVLHTYLAGFMPNRKATGIAEPIMARILYMEDANGPMAWITADLIGLMLPDTDELKTHIKGIKPERILFISTHVHSGPDTMGLWGKSFKEIPYKTGRDKKYMTWMYGQIADGVAAAMRQKRPALIGFGQDKSDKSKWTINIRQQGYHDHTMAIMRVDGEDGKPIACLVNYACHPEVLWDQNTLISPDYIHYLREEVEKNTGALSLFANAALGGMVTANLPDKTPLHERKVFVKEMGKALGKIAADTWASAKPEAVKEIKHLYKRFDAPFKNNLLFIMAVAGVFKRKVRLKKVETCLHVFRIGKAQFATLPGEPLPAIGFAAKDLLRGEPKFLFGLGDDELGYLLNSVQANDQIYKYERSVSIGPDGAEAILATLSEMAASI